MKIKTDTSAIIDILNEPVTLNNEAVKKLEKFMAFHSMELDDLIHFAIDKDGELWVYDELPFASPVSGYWEQSALGSGSELLMELNVEWGFELEWKLAVRSIHVRSITEMLQGE